jgi:hypothetical protein
LFSQCGSFDHSDLQSLNDCKFVFWVLQLKFQDFGGMLYTVGKIFSMPFQRYITCPQILKISAVKPKKQICNLLVTADQGGQKNRNGKMIAVLFYHDFY